MAKHRKSSGRDSEDKGKETPGLIGGSLNIFGVNIDLEDLVSAPMNLVDRLGELRERLKQAGGREALSDDEWSQGGVQVSGHIRTRGILGDQEFHLGTMGRPGARATARRDQPAPAAAEPPVDLFDEGEEIVIVADVPGVTLDDLQLKVEAGRFSLETKPQGARKYLKELTLDGDLDPDSLRATCHNGVLEVRIRKRASG